MHLKSDDDHKWPFKSCIHDGWHFDGMVWRYDDNKQNQADCCTHPTKIHQLYWEARGLYCELKWTEALPKFREIIKLEAKTNDDYMFKGRAYGHLGSILGPFYQFDIDADKILNLQPRGWSWLSGTPQEASPLPNLPLSHKIRKTLSPDVLNSIQLYLEVRRNIPQNDWESIDCYRREALDYKHPGSTYIYAMALVYGTGGVKRNIVEGIKLLNQAGAERIGEAFFELGTIYEQGVGDGRPDMIEKDIQMAQSYYMAAWQVYKLGGSNGIWVPEIGAIQRLLPSEIWHVSEDSVSALLGERFAWSVIGQAFLFGAAATYGSTAQPDHYPLLLLAIPILGMLLAALSYIVAREAVTHIERQRHNANIDAMRDAKIIAYKAIVDAVEACPYQLHPFKAAVKLEREIIRNTWEMYNRRRFFNRWIKILVPLVPVAFFVTWGFLFVMECISFNRNCSDWLKTTCMDNSVYCKNELMTENC